jgi:MFS family permease
MHGSVMNGRATQYLITATRLYSIQLDMFDGRGQPHDGLLLSFDAISWHASWLLSRVHIYAHAAGRATILELAAIPFVMGWLLIGLAAGQITLLIGRYFLGLATAIFMIVVPVYLSERVLRTIAVVESFACA